MVSAMKKEIVKGALESIGITDPRTVAGLAALTDTKFDFGPLQIVTEENGLTAVQPGLANGEVFKLTVKLEGKIAQELIDLYAGIAGRTTSGAEPLPASPLPVVAKPAGDAFLNESA